VRACTCMQRKGEQVHKEAGEYGSHIMIYMVIDRIGDIYMCVLSVCVLRKGCMKRRRDRCFFFFCDFVFIFIDLYSRGRRA